MTTIQVNLSDQETQALALLEQRTGKSLDELVHEAVMHLLIHRSPTSRLARLQQARGLWQDRDDIDAESLRKEFDRDSAGY